MRPRLALRGTPFVARSAALLAGFAHLAALAPVAPVARVPKIEERISAPTEAPTEALAAAPLEPRHWDEDDEGEGGAAASRPAFSSTSYRRCSAS